jgi:hypothetical protein
MSMRATEYDHFKPTPKTSMYGLGLVVVPIIVYAYLLKTSRVRHSWYQTNILK